MSAMLDEGKNELLVLSGKQVSGLFTDLEITFLVTGIEQTGTSATAVHKGLTEPKPHVYERILSWRGDAWNLAKSQRVDDAIRAVSKIAFGELEDPYTEARASRIQNPRFAVGKRVAEYRLVTVDDLDTVEQHARTRNAPR